MSADEAREKLFIALDFVERDFGMALAIAGELGSEVAGMKVGPELHNNFSWNKLSSSVRRVGARAIWLDENYQVGPDGMQRTISQKCSVEPPPEYITVSAFSGPDTIAAAVTHKHPDTKIVVATIDSHISEEQCMAMYGRGITSMVLSLGRIAAEAGADGVEASGKEMAALKEDVATKALIRFATGIRAPGDLPYDQRRISTLAEAFDGGADFGVIGRSVTAAGNSIGPAKALDRMLNGLR